MLKVLNNDLAPKINRAGMEVLKDDLPDKKEFVITVPLTPIQEQAYSIYVKSMLEGTAYDKTKSGDVAQTTMWHWLAILSLLCNHPSCFMAKLQERKEDARKALADTDADSKEVSVADSAAAIDAPLWKVGVSESLVNEEASLFKQVEDIAAVDLSHKVVVLCQILDYAQAAGDKTLVFSESILTLNYLSQLFALQKRKVARIDGQVKTSRRQTMTKDFNSGETDVFLISAKAGGLGLNLQGANRVVIFDFGFNPAVEEQAIGRAYRIGQTKQTYVYIFVAGGTFEEPIQNKTIFKRQLSSRVIDKKTPIAHAKKNLGEYLFQPRTVPQLDLSGAVGEDPLVLDKILALQSHTPTIRSILKTDMFDRHANDNLTAEDEKEVVQLTRETKLQREHPEKYAEMQRKLHQMQAAARVPSSQSGHHQSVPRPRGQFQNPFVPSSSRNSMGNGSPQVHRAVQGTNQGATPHPQSSTSAPATSPRLSGPIGTRLQEALELLNPTLSRDLAREKMMEISNFSRQSHLGKDERKALLSWALNELHNNETCKRLLTSQISVPEFMQPLLNSLSRDTNMRQNGQMENGNGQVCTPQAAPYFPSSQQEQFSDSQQAVKFPVDNHSAHLATQPASGSQARGLETPTPKSRGGKPPSPIKFNAWDTPSLLDYCRGRYGYDRTLRSKSRQELLALCEKIDFARQGFVVNNTQSPPPRATTPENTAPGPVPVEALSPVKPELGPDSFQTQ